MGGTHSVGRDNDELVDVLIQEKYICMLPVVLVCTFKSLLIFSISTEYNVTETH